MTTAIPTRRAGKICQLNGCDRRLLKHKSSLAEWELRKYCSKACQSRAQRVSHPDTKICLLPGCGETLIRHRTSAKLWEQRKYCGKDCQAAARRKPREHGTSKGVDQHRRLREPLCEPCQAVYTADNVRKRQERQANPYVHARELAANRARTRLSKMFPKEYAVLLAEETRRGLTLKSSVVSYDLVSA